MTYLRTSKTTRRGVAAVTTACLVASSGGAASASTVIAADLDYAIPVNSDASSASGFGIRAGHQARLPPVVALTPEVAFTYNDFSNSGPTAYRGLFGIRLAFGEILRPGVFTHVGLGHLSWGSTDVSHTGFSYDVGGFVDFTLLPVLNIGVHGAYNRVDSGDVSAGFGWASVGLHAALVF